MRFAAVGRITPCNGANLFGGGILRISRRSARTFRLSFALISATHLSMSANFNREHSSRGFKVVSGTSTETFSFYGFTVLADTVINALTAPTNGSPEGTAYDGDETGIAGPTLPPGYYPVRGSAIDLTSGSVILWKE